MKQALIITNIAWFMSCLTLAISENKRQEPFKQEIENYKAMEAAYFEHIEKCDTLHEKCFTIKEN